MEIRELRSFFPTDFKTVQTNKDIFTERQTSFKNIACLMLDFRRDILGGFLDTSSQELRVLNATKSDRQKCSILNLHVNRLLCK